MRTSTLGGTHKILMHRSTSPNRWMSEWVKEWVCECPTKLFNRCPVQLRTVSKPLAEDRFGEAFRSLLTSVLRLVPNSSNFRGLWTLYDVVFGQPGDSATAKVKPQLPEL